MHAQIECLLNGGCVASCSLEVAKFLRFVADGGIGSACVFRTEWRIYATDESVAGSIDFVAREPNGSLVLFDWKRARKLHKKDISFGKFMKSPVSHVPDAALWHYRLQLNLYKWILERYYSMHVAAMYVVSFHPDDRTFVDKVQDMQVDANAIMTYQRRRLQDRVAQTTTDCVGGAAENNQIDGDDMTFSQQVEAEMQDMELPLPKRCKVSSQGSAEDILKILHVDETSLLCDAFIDLPQSEEGSILREIEDVRAMVAQHSQSSLWRESLQLVAQGAICVHRLRLLDISRREEVLFLELIEGSSRHARAHGAQCFFFSEHGHWAAYNGVVPQGVLARCKKFLLFLEGLYRLLPTDTLRTPESIINAVSLLLRARNNSAEFLLQECEKAAICGSPVVSKKRRTAAIAQDDEDYAAEERDDNKPWTQVMASTVGKLYVKLHLSCKLFCLVN